MHVFLQLVGFAVDNAGFFVILSTCHDYSYYRDINPNTTKSRHDTHDVLYVSCRDVTFRACRARRDECVALVVHVAPCSFQHGRRRRSTSARVYKFSLLCSGFASISGTTLWRRPSTRFVRVAPVALVMTSVSRRAVRQARHSTSRLFLCQNAWVRKRVAYSVVS